MLRKFSQKFFLAMSVVGGVLLCVSVFLKEIKAQLPFDGKFDVLAELLSLLIFVLGITLQVARSMEVSEHTEKQVQQISEKFANFERQAELRTKNLDIIAKIINNTKWVI